MGILSAAHCMFPLSDPADYIAAGIKREGSSGGQKIDVKEVIIHPQYNESRVVAKYDNDIAILKLKEPLTFNADVRPARLPDSTLNPEDKGTFATISGWGTVSSLGPSSKDLKFAFVTFDHSTNRCGNYSREETIQGRKLFAEIRYKKKNQ